MLSSVSLRRYIYFFVIWSKSPWVVGLYGRKCWGHRWKIKLFLRYSLTLMTSFCLCCDVMLTNLQFSTHSYVTLIVDPGALFFSRVPPYALIRTWMVLKMTQSRMIWYTAFYMVELLMGSSLISHLVNFTWIFVKNSQWSFITCDS